MLPAAALPIARRVATRKPHRAHLERLPAYRALLIRLSENLRSHRENRRLTQEQIAELCDLNPRHIQKLESGEVNFTAITLAKLTQGLGLDAVDLLAPLRKRR